MDVTLNGETRLHLIVGDPIAQVRSPQFLTEILVRRGENALVVPAHVTAPDLPRLLASVATLKNLDSIVVTVPHKFAMLDFCDVKTPRAEFVGSTNVVHRRPDGRWQGDATDGLGYLDGIAKEGFTVAGKTALLVGAGGAGSAIALEILARGASRLAVHDVDAARRDALIAKLDRRFPGRAATGSTDPGGFDLVANATPLGMQPGDPFPVDPARLTPTQFVADVVTRPAVSPLIAAARALGCRTMTGAGMFDAQAELLVDRILGIGWD